MTLGNKWRNLFLSLDYKVRVEKMKSVGINEIAERLGISRNTVSKVMNNRGRVTEKTRNKIIEAAIEMGYSKLPNHLVDTYREEKNSKNILVIATSPDFSAFWGDIINGITGALSSYAYHCFYHFLTFEQEKNFILPKLIETGNIAGIIVMNVYHLETIKSIRSLGIPTVYYDLPLSIDAKEAKADVIVVEGRKSVYDLTKHLLVQGDTKLGFIGDITYCQSIEARWRGFIEAHEAMNLPIDEAYCLISEEKGHFYFGNEVEDYLRNLIEHKQDLPQAFICANDALAYKIISQLKAYGYKIPKDIRITGFDDIDRVGEKELTSVSVPIHYIGIRLAEQLVWRLQHPDRNYEMIEIHGDIHFRKSSEKID